MYGNNNIMLSESSHMTEVIVRLLTLMEYFSFQDVCAIIVEIFLIYIFTYQTRKLVKKNLAQGFAEYRVFKVVLPKNYIFYIYYRLIGEKITHVVILLIV